RYFGQASKMCRRGCLRCKSADCPRLSLENWSQRVGPQSRSQPRVASSRSVNFRFFAKRSAQFNERNARVSELRATMYAFDHQFDFVDRFCVISHSDEIRIVERVIGNGFSERSLVI